MLVKSPMDPASAASGGFLSSKSISLIGNCIALVIRKCGRLMGFLNGRVWLDFVPVMKFFYVFALRRTFSVNF